MNVTLERIFDKAKEYKADISGFLYDLVNIKSESRSEKVIIQRVKEEMQKVGFDKISIDAMGNILGYIGHGEHVIAFDANVDTKPIENPLFQVASDVRVDNLSTHKAGLATAIYAGKVIKDLKLEDDFTFVVTGTVQKEECEGLCWQFIIEEDNLKPEVVVLTEPTSNQIYLGQLGKIYIKIADITKSMDKIIEEIKAWNLKKDVSFGSSIIQISEVYHKDKKIDVDCVYLDILLRKGETCQSVLDEINNLDIIKETKSRVLLCDYEQISYTGLVYPCKKSFPAWHLPEGAPIISDMEEAYTYFYKEKPVYREWKHLTNGNSIMGRHNIKCIGFGPGDQKRIDDIIKMDDLIKATALYASLPLIYLNNLKKRNK